MDERDLSVDYDAVGELLRSQEMKSCVEEKAKSIKESADSMSDAAGYRYSTKKLSRYIGSVYTATAESAKDNEANNTLLKALR